MNNAFTVSETDPIEVKQSDKLFIKKNKGYNRTNNKCDIFSEKNLFEIVDSADNCNNSNGCSHNCREEICKLKKEICCLNERINKLENCISDCSSDCKEPKEDTFARIIYLEETVRSLKNIIFSKRETNC